MSVSFVESSQATGNSGTSVSLTLPTGSADGDYLVAYVEVKSGETISAPANWIQIGTQIIREANPYGVACFYKVRSGEAGPFAFTWPSSAEHAASMVSVRPTGQSSLIFTHAFDGVGDSSVDVGQASSSSLTGIAISGFGYSRGATNATANNGYTATPKADNNNLCFVQVGYKVITAAAVPAMTWTMNNGGDNGWFHVVVQDGLISTQTPRFRVMVIS